MRLMGWIGFEVAFKIRRFSPFHRSGSKSAVQILLCPAPISVRAGASPSSCKSFASFEPECLAWPSNPKDAGDWIGR